MSIAVSVELAKDIEKDLGTLKGDEYRSPGITINDFIGENSMKESKAHKATVNRIIKRYGGEYNGGKGADIKTPFRGMVEVETEKTVRKAPKKLQQYRGAVYIAGTNKKAVRMAIDVTEGTTIGVMDNKGNIVRYSSRAYICK